ncbi:DUF411 domain-containing protein [Roseateles sp. DAIF2]|uniref:DUF411 domain-containing protein n=1 Tax=Roseateles sp. DAIF2 TaxID=2714952 RepID=UPI0018A2E9B6|nr:DUF411 domain-containing protein [Roseateles sp. DAIF2]QPF74138.1 DUF411 domain-containing protein [Roseateles sp. DAIF2]
MITSKTKTSSPTRRRLLGAAAALAALPALAAEPGGPLVEIWKDPNCGCCQDWVLHLQAAGLRTRVDDVGNAAMRKRLGIDLKYGSCHTALVGGYAIEGHVPAREILRLLKERPKALGLAVPGMPVGSPGMDGPAYGDRKDPYDVLLLSKDGGAKVYQSYHRSIVKKA